MHSPDSPLFSERVTVEPEITADETAQNQDSVDAENVESPCNSLSKNEIITEDFPISEPYRVQSTENNTATDIESEASPSSEEDKIQSEQEKMDEAISLLAQSQNLWEQGELDGALELLDEAYALVLEVDGDPDISWQKDDVRFMIAKRILEIYASRSTVARGSQSEIPYVVNADVEKEIKCFKGPERKFLIASYKRSGQYRPTIVRKLKEAGLPEELSWLPLVESGFKINALSRARALGLWQFIPSTGYKFGLKRDLYRDERMDLEKSTDAAIAYLKELHGIFGDWLTVLAAYNCGEGRVLKVISRQHMNYLDNFWDLYRQLPFETARYVPRFLATVQIIQNPEKYGFDLTQEKLAEEIDYETVTVNRCMRLRDIAAKLDVSKDVLSALNSELRYKTTPEKSYALKIPVGMGEKFAQVASSINSSKEPGGPVFIRHKVRTGDTLSGLARRYRTSVRAIMAANRLSSSHRIRAGKWLKIPSKYYKPPTRVAKSGKTSTITARGDYVVKKGDSLWVIARRFNTTVSKIRRDNGLVSNRLKIGQVLKIGGDNKKKTTVVASANATSASGEKYTVQKGDSLYEIARHHNIRLDDLLRLNGMTKRSVIYPGQVIVLK